ncbi:MAG TPA: valine--tRNA ligase [Deltaproteobacteria bacterium]|nr:valine--tRNA ligase [Deltaproteobacteria bacterium]
MGKNMIEKGYDPLDIEQKWYRQSLEQGFFRAEDKSEKKPYAIVIPPPNVTGMLHMGHALNNTIQDIMTRFKRMQGYNALWMPGTDHAGIATQNVVEQELAKQGRTRHDLGRDKFVEKVWEWKKKYGGIILNQLQKLGCSCDWDRERFTMDDGLSRAVREVFVRLYNDGLIYQGDYIVNWCPRCHTAISDLEVEYTEERGGLWHIRYEFADGNGEIVVATTRPETMLGDTAVAVNPGDERYKAMVGKEVILPLMNKKIPIIADDYVSPEFGSGAVKITPSCDPNDFEMAHRHNIEIIIIMDGSAVINENGGPYQGQDRYEARQNVIEDLKKGGYLVKEESYTHNVGRCYRCKTIIEPAVSKQWFVKVKPLARVASSAVVKGKTKIVPTMWEGTYFDWMDNIRDWCISRQIWWGHRIPVWYCDECNEIIVSSEDPTHCTNCQGDTLRQDEDVLDTWFSSALWPFSTLGWPDKTEALETFYPTSLLVTGFDILFFWVARMMMMGLYAMKDVPFTHVYLHALVRDEHGDKMSKSKGNIIDPLEMIDKYGADAFRYTLTAFTAQGRDVKMSEERIQGYRFFVNKIWNAARFCFMNLHDYPAEGVTPAPEDYSIGDRWIRDRLNQIIKETVASFDEYRFNDAASKLYHFVWHEFCDWYLELIKPMLYGSGSHAGRRAAQHTLVTVLKTVVQLLHPIMPFVTEEIWSMLPNTEGSIVISSFPEENESLRNDDAVTQMKMIQDVIACIRNIRGEMNIAPSKKLNVLLSAPDNDAMEVLNDGKDYILDMANLSNLSLEKDVREEQKHAATGIAGSVKVFVLLEGMIDIAAERSRLDRELAKVNKDLDVVSRKLANQDFREKASGTVIEKEMKKSKDLKEKCCILENALKRLDEIEG